MSVIILHAWVLVHYKTILLTHCFCTALADDVKTKIEAFIQEKIGDKKKEFVETIGNEDEDTMDQD